MKITQYCIRCGCKMELNFGRRFKRSQCPGCKLKFKYKEAENGGLTYDYNQDDVKDLYVEGADGQAHMRLIDIAQHNREVQKRGAV